MQGQVFPSATDQPVNCTLIAGLHLQFEKPSIVSAPVSLFSNTIIGVDLKFLNDFKVCLIAAILASGGCELYFSKYKTVVNSSCNLGFQL